MSEHASRLDQVRIQSNGESLHASEYFEWLFQYFSSIQLSLKTHSLMSLSQNNNTILLYTHVTIRFLVMVLFWSYVVFFIRSL